jgi:hypothetical protein
MECQKHDDYQQSITWLMDFVEEYVKHGLSFAEASKGHATDMIKDENLKRATRELRTLLERFANGLSLDIVLDAVNAIIDDTRRDESLREWFSAINAYIRKVLLEPGYVMEPDCNNQAIHLRETGRQFYDEKYKDQFDTLFKSIGTWFKAFGDDPVRPFHHDTLPLFICNFYSSISSSARTGLVLQRTYSLIARARSSSSPNSGTTSVKSYCPP